MALANQSDKLVRAVLSGTRGPMVSRWGHILMRRALASRLAAPLGMDPVEFAALRVGLLNRMGEFAAARAVVQATENAVTFVAQQGEEVQECKCRRVRTSSPQNALTR